MNIHLKTFISCLLGFLPIIGFAQDAKELQETAKTYMRQGDYANASLVLTRALQIDPKNIELSKDLALNYWLQKEYAKGIDVVKPLLDRDDSDDQTFQIAGNIYRSSKNIKEAEKVYKKAVKKFPASGPIYNDYGELLWSQGDINAIKQWERGIEKDPEFSGNYYNAARYYYFTKDKIWGLIYGEIFLNLETFTARTAEMKSILLEGYKKLFIDPDFLKIIPDKENFESSYIGETNKQSEIAASGINVESLTMIRSRFILNWFEKYGKKYPYRLFEYHRQLLQDGLFDAYNQWIFGVVQNLQAYQNWTTTHPQEYNEFNKFQKNKLFKIPKGQYWHK